MIAADPVAVGVFAALAVALVAAYLMVAWAVRHAPKATHPKHCTDVATSPAGLLSCIHGPNHGGAHVNADGTRWVRTGEDGFYAWNHNPLPFTSVHVVAALPPKDDE